MFSSLRVRLPLVFLAGIVVAGVITTAISVRLFQQFARDQAISQLSREGHGIAALYVAAVRAGYGNRSGDRLPPTFAAKNLALTTGAKLYWVGPRVLFPGQEVNFGLPRLPLKTIDWTSGKSLSFEFTPPSAHRRYIAVANPLILGSTSIGAIVVAQPKTDVGRRVRSLIYRLAVAGLIGLAVAGLLGWYLSRRLVRPILQLANAADEVSKGNYDVRVPRRAPGELGHLSERFDEMAHRLGEVEAMERNFLMSVSHELRTPLTAIRGHVAALREGVVEDEELVQQSLETVELEAQRLERLVGDILDLAKLDTRRFQVMREEVDMEQLLEQAFERYREEAQRRSIDYRCELNGRPVIESDGDRVLQVVGNLLSNAFKATPDGGRISLELAQQNGTVHVVVEDSGPGIPEQSRERIFRPFVSHVGGGTGLGLPIARELSSALGGRLELESEVGRGSRFELVLPVS